jgi:hypothetical protein
MRLVSICTSVLVKQVHAFFCTSNARNMRACEEQECADEYSRSQDLYFCTSKAGKLSTHAKNKECADE